MASPSPLKDTPPAPPLYIHTPLTPADKSIRLLRIRYNPTTRCNSFSLIPIECIPGSPPTQSYEAISWSWDAPEHRGACSLTIDGANLAISTNMHGILQQLLRPHEPSPFEMDRFVWIDSICIRQDDTAEKGKQLPLMTTIYKSAVRVLAFPLPMEHEPTHLPLAAEFLDRLSDLLDAKVLPETMGIEQRRPFIGLQGDLPLQRDRWRAFIALVSSQFWTRAWIIQEIVVGRAATVRYGGKEIDFGLLGRVMLGFKSIDPASQMPLLTVGGWVGAQSMGEFRTGIDLIVRLHGFRQRYAAGQMPSVSDILVECVQSRASYACDKVWALGGIGADLDLQKLRLTEQQSLDDQTLFTSVTRYIVENMKAGTGYTLLAMAGVNRESKRAADWPSWVPDLDATPKLYPLGNAACPYTAGCAFPAIIKMDRPGPSETVAVPDPNVLQMKGFLLGSLEYVNNDNPYISLGGGHVEKAEMELFDGILNQPRTNEETKRFAIQNLKWIRILRDETFTLYRNLGKSTETYSVTDGESLVEAILRTIIADHGMKFPASNTTIDTISTWFAYMLIITGLEDPNGQDETAWAWHWELVRETLKIRLKDCGGFQGSPGQMETVYAVLLQGFSREVGDILAANDVGADRLRRFTQISRNTIARRAAGKQFALSKEGLMLLVPKGAQKGDFIVVFGEARVPYLLRPCGGGDDPFEVSLVGEAYVHGFGRGDLLAASLRGRDGLKWFAIR